MKNSLSFKTLLGIYLFLLAAFIFYQPGKKAIHGGADSSGYYAYLPASFIYHDLKTLDECLAARIKYTGHGSKSMRKLANGNHLNQYTCGVAILNIPAFLIAHTFCHLTSSYPADGYAAPYAFMISFSGLFYVFIGLFFSRRFLLHYFNEQVVALSLLLLGLGSNLYFTAILQGAMAHAYLFCLGAILMWLTQKWKTTAQHKYVYWIALTVGMITLIRPNVMILAFIPLLMAYKQVFALFKQPLPLFFALILCFLPLAPQLFYWKMITGDYITYSYGNQSFDFANPHLLEGLFGFKNGWLAYSPLMVTVLLGLIIGMLKKQYNSFIIFTITLLHAYVIYSWWCWYYINGFGSRAMVDIYGILVLPIGLFIHTIRDKLILKRSFYTILILLIGLNLFQTHQHYTKVLWSEGGNKAYYFSVFGKATLDHNALVALDCNIAQPRGLKFKKSLAEEGFENVEKANTSLSFSGKKSFYIRPGHEYSVGLKTHLINAKEHKTDWLRISVQGRSEAYGTYYDNSHLVVTIDRDGQSLLWKSIRINNKIRDTYYSVHNGEINQWKEVYFFIPLEKLNLQDSDQISVYGWNSTQVPVYIDDLKVEVWGD